MRVTGKIVWIIFWCGLSGILTGQTASSFQHFSKEEGLSQASVFAIAQDSAGFMWFGTRDGLNKFDGYNFKIFRRDSQKYNLVFNDIRSLYCDPLTHDLWIGTNSGLSRYTPDTEAFTNYLHEPDNSFSLSSNAVRQVFRDSKSRLWVCTSIGLNLFDESNGTFTRYLYGFDQPSGQHIYDLTVICEDGQGQLFLGTDQGLFRAQKQGADHFEFNRVDTLHDWRLADTHIKTMVCDSRNNLWIGTSNGGLHFWNRTDNTLTHYQSDLNKPGALSHNNIRAMCIDAEDNLWVGTFSGLNYLPKNNSYFSVYKKDPLNPTGLSDNSIRALFLDKQGSLWAGTYYGGVNHLHKHYNQFSNFRHLPFKNSISGNVVSSFAEDKNGHLWIGTEGGGLNRYNPQTNHFDHFKNNEDDPHSISGDNVKSVLLDGNQLWVGTFQHGLNLMDLDARKFRHFRHDPNNNNSLSANNIYGLRKEKDKLWILTYGKGLDILDLNKNVFTNFRHQQDADKSISSNLTRVCLKTSDGQIWIGTEDGLNKIAVDDEGMPKDFIVYLPEERIYTIQESYDNNIWIGTFDNGLFLLNTRNSAIEHYSIEDGLPGNSILGILVVGENEVWLSTNNGLSKFNPIEKTFINYDYNNGLTNSEFNFNAYYKTRSGDLLFGGINGFTRFDPAAIRPNTYVPPVVFTDLRQNNQTVTIGASNKILKKTINQTDQLTLSYNDANFSIVFSALDYFNPENNHYRFKLEGLDKEWRQTIGETEATYTIQQEGTYVFRLLGGNSDGVWNPQERKITIQVLPPWYRSWWAYLIYLLALAGLIFGLVRFVRLRHKLQLQQIAKKQQDEMHEMKLRFFTNITHEFRTPLTLILGPLRDMVRNNNQREKTYTQLVGIERNAQRLLNLVNQLMTFRKLATDHQPLQIVKEDIVHFLKELFLPFQDTADRRNIQLNFSTDRPEIFVHFDPDKLEKVFFNLLSNAFKFTPDGGQIRMHILEQAQEVEIRVTDSGPGIDPDLRNQIFKRFYEKSNTNRSTIKGTGIGLAISKQMVELHQGQIFVAESQTEGDLSGATFVVRIPIVRARLGELQENRIPPQTKPATTPATAMLHPPVSAEKKIAATGDKNALPTLLVVEDNLEVRSYVRQIFEMDYRVIEAENGQIGLEQTREHSPDLIISDVMMPQMDGIAFCRKVKSELAISHIPIILLTARTASMFKIEGLETGADDYITKPFLPEELRLRVRNIIKARKYAREKFMRVMTIDPKEISVTSADETFLKNALEIVENNMDNYQFNVLQFASDLAVSRPLLFTKMKALTGQTPNNFIKTIRLKRAAQLLKTQKLSISEVGYMVGFKDPKYFRKCFKAQFNKLPSAYSKGQIE